MRLFLALCVSAFSAISPVLAADSSNGEMVTITPAPGLSFQIPHGWVACDPDSDKLLGNAADPVGLRREVCRPIPGVDYVFRAFNPDRLRIVSMTVSYSKEQQVSAEILKAMTPDMIASLPATVCPEATKPMVADGTRIDSCTADISTIDGQLALHTSIVATPPPPSTALQQFTIDMYEFPYAHGYALIQFNTPMLMREGTKAMIDAIRSSVKAE